MIGLMHCRSHRDSTVINIAHRLNLLVLKTARYSLVVLILVMSLGLHNQAFAQGNPEERLAQGKPGKNIYRGGEAVDSWRTAQQNMADLFSKIMITGPGDGKADRWYSPHLRDIHFNGENRISEAVNTRGQAIPEDFMLLRCINPFGPTYDASCPIGAVIFGEESPLNKCKWHGEPAGNTPHRPWKSCVQRNTRIYKKFITNSNFKICCVPFDKVNYTSEQIVSDNPDGDGWAGLFEYYFPVTAVGWENDRTTTKIVEKDRVKQCVDKAGPMMHNAQATDWVTGAISRGRKYTSEGSGTTAAGLDIPDSTIKAEVQKNIQQLTPEDPELRMTDSLSNVGLTVRVNLATMDPLHRRQVARRFCMRDEQFDKLMDGTGNNTRATLGRGDPTQLGGGPLTEMLAALPIFANYCEEGANLMTKPENSKEVVNFDNTPTNFPKGMDAWEEDPRYCQQMNLENPNLHSTGFNKAVEGVQKRRGKSESDVGYTCRKGGKLNGGVVPLTIGRHAAVERRAVIGDLVYGMLHAARLAPGMHVGNKSYLKGYDERPYSLFLPWRVMTFLGARFEGGGTNELERVQPQNSQCSTLSGEPHFLQHKGDILYLSDKTGAPFTQEKVEARGASGQQGINRYAQEWAADEASGKEIAKRGLDDQSSNYATAFRFFATCPAGFLPWKPAWNDPHDANTRLNLEVFCRDEYFGGISPKIP